MADSNKLKINARKGGESYELDVKLPENLQDAVNTLGSGVVFHRFQLQLQTELREVARRAAEKYGKENPSATPEQLIAAAQAAVSAYAPKVSNKAERAVSKVDKILEDLDPESRKAVEQALAAKAASATAE